MYVFYQQDGYVTYQKGMMGPSSLKGDFGIFVPLTARQNLIKSERNPATCMHNYVHRPNGWKMEFRANAFTHGLSLVCNILLAIRRYGRGRQKVHGAENKAIMRICSS